MGLISDRIEATLEDWSTKFKDRLRGWLVGAIGFGLEIFMDIIGKAAAPKLKPLLDLIDSTGKVPPELAPLLDELRNPTGEVAAMFAQSAGNALVGGAINRIVDAILLPVAYDINKTTRNVMLSAPQFIESWLRGEINDTDLDEALARLGIFPEYVTLLKKLSQARLNPETAIRVWRRKPVEFANLLQDLADQGITADRIEALKVATEYFPSPQELILWSAKEVFEPELRSKYGLDDGAENLQRDLFHKIGMTDEQIDNNWAAHWIHPSIRQVYQMLHRGLITEEDVSEYYGLVEIPPHWRDNLTELSWDLPNRIELRMMARFGLVDKPYLVEQLKKVGLGEEYRDIAADMMLTMGIRTDLSTRYSKGWLDADGVRAELNASGLSEPVANRLFQWIVKNTGTDRVEKERDLTKSEIYKAIKKGRLLPIQGVELIRDMGYDENEAILLIEINVGALEGSPDTYQELKKITQLYRRSQGLEAKIPSQEIIEAEKSILDLEAAIKKAELGDADKKEIASMRETLEAEKVTFHSLRGEDKGEA